jgi:hypothetical protein
LRIGNGLNNLFMYCFYYIKNDQKKEPLGKVVSTSRLKAAQSFAERKQLPLKDFLKLFSVEKKNPFLL